MADSILRVDMAGRAYDIVIGDGVLARSGPELAGRAAGRSLCIVCDSAIAHSLLPGVIASLKAAGFSCGKPVIVPSGESSKSFSQLQSVCEQVLALRIERGTMLVALGGGVIGDLTGFAASILLRGLPFVQMPTTLLSQVDSSVGGKTGINVPAGKNLVGAFHQPILVLSDVAALETLPQRQIAGGYAELVKHALIADAAFFGELEVSADAIMAGDRAIRQAAIARSCAIKAEIVCRDEKETGDRAFLNFGHTFGHAIEALTGFGEKVTHGEAVSIGMAMAFDASVRMGLCPDEDRLRAVAHLRRAGLPVALEPAWKLDAAAIYAAMETDKKKQNGRIKFVVSHGIGRVSAGVEIPQDKLLETLEQFAAH